MTRPHAEAKKSVASHQGEALIIIRLNWLL